MHTLLSIALALVGVTNTPALPDKATVSAPLPMLGVACEDSLDFLLQLGQPGLQTKILGVADSGALTMVSTLVTTLDATAGKTSWIVIYTFPSTIFAHSIVTVRVHAEEME